MNNLTSYSGITTKIRAMEGRLLKEDNYKELASMNTIPEAVSYLKKHPSYSAIFSDLNETDLHRGQVEKYIFRSMQTDFKKLYRFANLNQRKFLIFYFKRYEISTLKKFLRIIFNENDVSKDFHTTRQFFQNHSKIQIEKVSKSLTISELVASLKGTDYYDVFSKLNSLASPTLFDYELALDHYFFQNFWRYKEKILKGKELNNITKIYGHKIDLLNIQWIYRSKKYYKLSNSELYAMLISVNYKLTKEDFIKLVESSNLDEFTLALDSTYYGKKYHLIGEQSIGQVYREVMDYLNTSVMKKNPYSISIIDSYLYLKDREIDKLTTILECVRYGLNPDESLKYIK